MSRWFAALGARVVVTSVLAILVFAAPLLADTTYELTATPAGDDWTSFSLVWIDTVGNGLFDGSGLQSFSGPTHIAPNPGVFVATSILVVPRFDPDLSPYTNGPATDLTPQLWVFGGSGTGTLAASTAFGAGAGQWTYTRTVVPLPSSVFLLGSGLIGLAVARRRKRWGK